MLWIILACVDGEKVIQEEDDLLEQSMDTAESDTDVDPDTDPDTGPLEELSSEECDDAYLLELNFSTFEATIWRYDIATKAIVELGVPECPLNVTGDYMVAMTADSKGQLWMLSRYGDIYMVVPANLYCSYTGINFVLSEQFTPQGIAFMRADESSPDVLYASGVRESDQQAYIGVQSGNSITVVGGIDGIAGQGNNIIDLAGTADGRLFGLRPSGSQSALTEIDPNSATPTNEWMLDIPAPNGWSFVSLFGEFWTFTSEAGASTEVHWFDPDTETLAHQDTLNFQVVGAALPTCAPETSGSK